MRRLPRVSAGKLAAKGARRADTNKTSYRGRVTCGGETNLIMVHFVVSLSERNDGHGIAFITFLKSPEVQERISNGPSVSWHFDFNVKLIGGKKKISIRKRLLLCKTAHSVLPQIFPDWQSIDGAQRDAFPRTVGKTEPSSGTV